ncbi:MAG: bud emergence protein 1 [Trizodia sp. TS-e1964]|nr:MAG: bud emergence protein 1 [Trizodia sp. TS-e1964]
MKVCLLVPGKHSAVPSLTHISLFPKALRRSIKGDKTDPEPRISIAPKSALTITPPKKVIKALHNYEANPQNVHELSFTKGDFFHVIGRENDQDWYEACNPATNARGLVPVSFFQALGRTADQRDSEDLHTGADGTMRNVVPIRPAEKVDSGHASTSPPTFTNGSQTSLKSTDTQKAGRISSMGKQGGGGAMVYGIVLYDFEAERPDELEAKSGEAIIVIAQSNPEWFVAKPIGRLGGPGLIPVSFIQIKDMLTGAVVPDAQEAVIRAGVPKVEEWKKLTADYKNSSITLGKFESGNRNSQQNGHNPQQPQNGRNTLLHQSSQNDGSGPYQQQPQQNDGTQHQSISASPPYPAAIPYGQQPNASQTLRIPISARIPRFCFANDKYWYVILAVLDDGTHWELSRFYQDFYDFQIALLTEFPEEAGNLGKPRTLPFMPGPVTYVTDTISAGRRQNLDEYIQKLLTMPSYISRCQLVRQLFAPREGDYEMDPNISVENFNRLSVASQHSSNESPIASQQSSRGNLSNPSASQQVSGLSAPPHQRTVSDVPTTVPSAMKVKVYFQDDIIAIRVPIDIPFQQLKAKLQDRFCLNENFLIQYRDEPASGEIAFYDIISDADLDTAIKRNSKLILYVGYHPNQYSQ